MVRQCRGQALCTQQTMLSPTQFTVLESSTGSHPSLHILLGITAKASNKTRHFQAFLCWINYGRVNGGEEHKVSFLLTQEIMQFTWHRTMVVIITHYKYKILYSAELVKMGQELLQKALLASPLKSTAVTGWFTEELLILEDPRVGRQLHSGLTHLPAQNAFSSLQSDTEGGGGRGGALIRGADIHRARTLCETQVSHTHQLMRREPVRPRHSLFPSLNIPLQEQRGHRPICSTTSSYGPSTMQHARNSAPQIQRPMEERRPPPGCCLHSSYHPPGNQRAHGG